MTQEINIDTEEIEALTEEYVTCGTPKRRREIEIELLEATLWKALERENGRAFAEFSEEEMELISDAIEGDDPDVSRLVRRPFLDNL
ncbi:hypothetical protein DJ84_12245 [Halorubrum ezzemoulense]|nr:hypothetical protein DJ84_12245 [Halorubrum ezzemoulense]